MLLLVGKSSILLMLVSELMNDVDLMSLLLCLKMG